MKMLKTVMIAMLLAGAAGLSLAATDKAEPAKGADTPEAVIKRSLESSRPDIKVSSVAPSPIAGVYEVQVENGPIVYASPDGKYFVAGDLFQVKAQGFANLAEEKRNVERAKAMASVKLDDMIVFKPKGPTKAFVSVFTDVDCGYCQKLHQEVPALNAMGIEVRYLAFPRAGVGSPTYEKLVTAWCAKDRQATLTRYKNREAVPTKTCANNPVAAEYALGESIGINGTPALITAKGELLPGYMPAAELAKRLNVN
jgi:thiol:disulfide interchange protein DsbC